MDVIGDLGDLTKDQAAAKAILDYGIAKLSAMLDEKLDRLERLTLTLTVGERQS